MFWEGGKCSGTMYCGDHDHYDFMTEAFGLFAHVNVLQRDMCPSATRFEGEIIAMALDLFHAEAVTDSEPAGLVTSGGTGSILHAVLAYREFAAQTRGVTRPNLVKPETAHPAFDKACHLFGIEVRTAPVDPDTTTVDCRRRSPTPSTTRPIAIVGSACNYPYGTDRPDRGARRSWPSSTASACTSTAASAGSSSRSARSSGTTSRCSTSGSRASRASRPTPTSTATRSRARRRASSATRRMRNSQYFFLTGWTGGKYFSPGIEGSRSGGLIASAWASMVHLGREGYLALRQADLRGRRGDEGGRAVAPRAAAHGRRRRSASASRRTSSTSTTSTTSCDRRAGASTASSTRTPSTWPRPGRRPSPASSRRSPPTWPRRWPTPRRKEAAGEAAFTSAIYGGVAGGLTDEADEFIRSIMTGLLDTQQSPPARMTTRSRDEQLVLAVDLGTGGPKVGFVSLTGKVAWQDHYPVPPPALPEGGAEQDADEWWTIICDARAQGHRQRRRPRRRGRGGRRHRAVGQHRAGRREGRAGRSVHPVAGLPRRPARATSGSPGPVAGYKPSGPLEWVRKTGGVPGDHRRRSPTSSTSSTTGPRSPRRPAGTSSRSTTSRCASPARPPRRTRR